MRRPIIFASILTLLLLGARALGAPAITDPTGAPLPPGVHLHFPALNLILAPLFDTWDGVSMLGMRQLRAFFIWIVVAIVVWRVAAASWSGVRALPDAGADRRGATWRSTALRTLREVAIVLALVIGLGLFGFVGLIWHRPMVSLAGVPAGWVVMDLHTHTNVSHDVQGGLMVGFDAEAARRWHRRGGFDAFFITDHNRVDGITPAALSPDSVPVICPGEEVSAYDQHVVILGNTTLVDKRSYNDSLPGILRLFHDAGARYGALAVASIPEYEKHHLGDLDRFVDAGAAGFEIVNGAPKANELTTAHRDSVIAVARRRNVFVDAVSDGHGWGATVEGWTLVRVGGETEGRRDGEAEGRRDGAAEGRRDGAAERRRDGAAEGRRDGEVQGRVSCGAILTALRSEGFSATQVVARHRLTPDSWWPRWLTPVAVVAEGWRSAGWGQVVSWLLWIWGLALLADRRRALRAHDRP